MHWASKACLRTRMNVAVMFVTEKGEVSTFCTSGGFHWFVVAASEAVINDGHADVVMDIAQLIHAYNDGTTFGIFMLSIFLLKI